CRRTRGPGRTGTWRCARSRPDRQRRRCLRRSRAPCGHPWGSGIETESEPVLRSRWNAPTSTYAQHSPDRPVLQGSMQMPMVRVPMHLHRSAEATVCTASSAKALQIAVTRWQTCRHGQRGREAGVRMDGEGDNSTVRRILLGTVLRKLRNKKQISAKEAGYHIRGTESKISRMETGKVSFKERDVADLLTLYGVTDGKERDQIL